MWPVVFKAQLTELLCANRQDRECIERWVLFPGVYRRVLSAYLQFMLDLLILLSANHCWVTRYWGGHLENVSKKFKSYAHASPPTQPKPTYKVAISTIYKWGINQALTMEKVIHQSSKLKSNKINWMQRKEWGREMRKKAGMDKNWYFHYSPYLVCIFEGMATHILQNSLE